MLTILVPEFAQESTLHFRYLLAENGGFLHVAPSIEEHVEQLRSVLDEDEVGANDGASRRGVRSSGRARPAGDGASGSASKGSASSGSTTAARREDDAPD